MEFFFYMIEAMESRAELEACHGSANPDEIPIILYKVSEFIAVKECYWPRRGMVMPLVAAIAGFAFDCSN
jgi:hypothetical protein